MEYKIISKYLEPLFETPEDFGYWFGYYNYDPLNYDQTKMLCHKTYNDAQVIKKGMTVDVGYFDLKTSEWHKVGVSDSYNWPQGSMLQWLPGGGNEKKLIYNLSKDGRLISRIHDIESGEDKDIDWPIYGMLPDGKHSISIDIERSYYSLAYHYESVVNESKNVRVLKDDGIFNIDLTQNKKKCIIPIEKIISIEYRREFEKCKHWLEHVMVSRNGKRICFLHRFCPINDINDRKTRLFIADSDGKNLQLIKNWASYRWSHFGWDGDDAFSIYTYLNYSLDNGNGNRLLNPKFFLEKLVDVIYRRIPTSIGRKLKNYVIGQSSYYQYYKIGAKSLFELCENYKQKEFAIDGHQNFTKDGLYMIADTYPDENQYQNIIIYNKQKKKNLVVGRLYAGLHRKPGSCDLHPKLCKNNEFLMVDSAYNGKHHLVLFKLNWNLINRYFENGD